MRLVAAFVLCLVLASGHGRVLFKSGVHRDLCAWGSQYWCSSEKTAERCGKTEFCATRVWTLDIIQDAQCQVTQQVVKNARQLMDTRTYKMSSEHDIALLIAKACSNFEDDIYRLQCKAIVINSDILPKLLKLITTRLPTESVALAVGGCQRQAPASKNCHSCEEVTNSLQQYVAQAMTKDAYMNLVKSVCNKHGTGSNICLAMAESKYSVFRDGLVKARPSQVCAGKSLCLKKNPFPTAENSELCSVCKSAVQELRDLDRNQEVESALKNLMKLACTQTGEFKDLCDVLADKGMTYIFELIASELNPIEVCERLNLCHQAKNDVLVPTKAKGEKGIVECTLCKILLAQIEKLITSKTATSEIEKILLKFCGDQPPSLQTECTTFINQFGPIIIQAVIKNVPPKRVCELINVCQNKVIQKPTVGKQKTEICAICITVMQYAEKFLTEKSTKDEITAFLNTVCNILPDVDKDLCLASVPTFVDYVINLFEQDLSPKELCQLVKFCSKDMITGKNAIRKMSSKATVKKGVSCTLCHLVFKTLDNMLEMKATENEVRDAFDKVCDIMPEEIKEQCIPFVALYAPYVIDLVVEELTYEQICLKLGICTSASEVVLKKPDTNRAVGKGELCPICTYVFTALDKLIDENTTKDEVVAALDKVCDILPSEIKPQCIAFVTLYGPYVIDLLVQHLPPKDICDKLGLCTNTGEVLLKKPDTNRAVGKGELCPICTYVFTTLDKLIDENTTKDEVVAALDKVCDILPSEIKPQCIAFVTLYGPYVIDLLVQHLPPKDICDKLGLCTNTGEVLLKKPDTNRAVGKGELCPICTYVFTTLDKLIDENTTKDEVVAALDKVCDILPSEIKPQCIAFVTLYGPYVIDLLVQHLPPKDICDKLGLCTNTVETGPKSQSTLTDSQLCDLCKYVFNYLDNILKDNATKKEIETALEAVCDIIPESLRSECIQLVDTYTPQIIELLLQEVQPKQVCTNLGLCTSFGGKVEMLKPPKVKSADKCTICLFVIGFLENKLQKNTTEQEIEHILERICDVFPSTLKADCESFIAKYLPELVKSLTQVTPDQACTLLGVCQAKAKVEMPKPSKAAAAGQFCTICEFVMNYLEDQLKDTATQQEIEQVLEKVCDVLPVTVKSECDNLIKQYFPMLVQLLTEMSPKTVCTALKMCPSQAKVEMPKPPKEAAAGQFCTICEFVMNYLEDQLKDNATQQEIEQALEKVCDVLPATVKSECDNLIKQYFPMLVQLLTEMSPKTVCTAFKLCPSQAKVEMPKPPKEAAAGQFCTICEFVMNYLEDQLKDNATQQEIEQALEKVCDVLPATVKSECDNLIKQYFPMLVQLLTEMSPKTVCTALKMCPSQAKVEMPKPPKEAAAGQFCTICEFVMNYLEDQLKDNATQQEIEQALEKVCDVLPATVKSECDNLIKQYFPMLVQLLTEMSPKTVCTALKLCPSQAKVEMPKPPKEAAAGQFCTICEFVMNYLEDQLKDNATQQEIEQALEKVCDVLPATVKSECDNLIKQYFPMLVQLLTEMSPKTVCTALKLCPSQAKVEMPKPPKEAAAGQFCTICEFVMNYLEDQLKDNATQQEIEQALEKVCDVLPATVKSECDNLIKQYFPMLVQLLTEMSPKTVCTALKLCPSQAKVEMPKPPKEAAAGQFCTICEFVMNYLEDQLKDNATQQEIEQALEKVCDVLPATVKSECDNLIKQYFPMLVQLLTEMSPKTVCTALKLCPSQAKVEMPKPPKEAAAGQFCTICEFVMNYLEDQLKDNATQQEIEQALEKVCDVLPATVKSECDNLIKQYFPMLVQLLTEMSPKTVCTALKLCPSQAKVEMPKPPKEAAAGQFCTICEFVMNYLEDQLKDNATQQEIEQALEKVCDVLPATVKSECDNLIKQYFPMLVQLLTEMSPKTVCMALKLCPSQAKVEMPKPPKEAAAGQFCTICEFVMNYLEDQLKDNATQQEIEQALEKVCDVLPATVKSECDNLIKQYFPMLVQLLTEMSPKTVCTALKLCPSQAKVEMPKPPKEAAAGQFCTICEFVMNYLEDQLKDNATQQEIEQALEKVCDVLPATVKSECDNLIKQYFPMLVQLLTEMSPKTVCTALKLCPSQAKVEMPKLPKEAAAGQFCTICEFVMNYLEDQLKDNATQQEIEQALEKVCDVLPATVKSECDDLIKQYFPVLVQLLLTEMSPKTVCTALKMCPSQAKVEMPKPPKEAAAGQFCTICEFVMNYLEDQLKDNATQQEIEQALDKVCDVLPATVKSECDDLIKQYFPVLVQLLLTEMSPKTVCTALKMCPSQAKVEMPKPPKEAAAGQFCTICEFVMNYLEDQLKDNATQQEIEQALEKVCDVLPATVKSECDNLIKQYFPMLVQLLTEMSPKTVCTALKLCPSQAKVEMPKLPKEAAAGQFCTICEFVMNYLEDHLKDNATQQEIEQALEKVCDVLPATVKSECDDLIKQYFPVLVQLLLTEMSPKTVCTALKMCPSQAKVEMPKPPKEAAAGQFCTICEFVMNYLEDQLKDNATQQEIEQALDKVCDVLPATVKSECDDLIKQYFPVLVQLLLTEMSPKTVCTALKMCPSQAKVEMPKPPKEAAAGQFCTICEFVMNYLEDQLKDNATQQEIEQALEKVCDVLPATVKSECDNLIKQYFPMLVQLLTEMSPKTVCTALKLCPSQAKVEMPKPPKEAATGQFCTICEFVMNYLEDQLKDNATQQEIEQALEKVCDVLPATVKSECDDLIKQYFPMLVQLLTEMSPKTVCTALKMCPSQGKALKLQKAKVSSNETCFLCETVLTYVDHALAENATQQEIEDALKHVCGVLPSSLKDQCDSLVGLYFPLIVQLFEKTSPLELCTILKLCPQPAKLQTKVEGVECILCEFVLSKIESLISSNSTANEIEKALEKVCSLLPSSIKVECDAFINTYGKLILQLIVQEIKPKEVCTVIGLCSSQIKYGKNNAKLQTKVEGVECILCEFVLSKIESLISSNSTANEIEKALEKVCSLLPSSIKVECDAFINTYGKLILQLIVQEIKPKEVCTVIGLCSSQIKYGKNNAKLQTKVEGVECILCEFVLSKIESLISSNSTANEIEKALEKVCSLLPSSIKVECDAFINTYGKLILQLIVQEIKPKEVCTVIGLCSSQIKYGKNNAKLQTKVEGVECILCEFVLSKIESLISSNSTANEIEKALEKVCSLLPSSIKAECDAFINTYGKLILQAIVLGLKPKEVCTVIGLCSSQIKYGKNNAKMPARVNGPDCIICEFVMKKLEGLVTVNSTATEIEKGLEIICTILPSTIKQNCDNFIKQYTPQLLKLLLAEVKPRQVCIGLGLCSSLTRNEKQRPVHVMAKKSSLKSDELCELCQAVMTELENVLSSKASEDEIKEALENVCVMLPKSVSEECKNVIDVYTPYIIQLLVQEVSPKMVCGLLRLCQSSGTNNLILRKKTSLPKAGPLCAICEFVLDYFDKFLEKNSTEAEIEAAMENVCKILPANIKNECIQLVDLFGPQIIDLLVKELDPKTVCSFVRACTNTTVQKVVPVKSKPVTSPSTSCVLCELIIGKLETMIESKTSEADIKFALEKVCGYMPQVIKEECDAFVDKYTALIVKAIIDGVPSDKICSDIGLCSSSKRVQIQQSIEGCTLCKFLMGELKGLLNSPGAEAEIMDGLNFICKHLPHNLQTPCTDLVTMFGPNLIKFLDGKIAPIAICQLVELCASPEIKKQAKSNALTFVSEQKTVSKPVVPQNLTCPACKFAWYEIQVALKASYWQTEVKTILLHLCSHVKTWPDVCKYLVNEDLPGIISEISGFRFPITFCQELEICPPPLAGSTQLATGFTECEICKLLADITDSFLQKKSTMSEAEALLTRVCNTVIPDAEKSKCVSIVQQYTPLLLELVAQFMNPEKVCETMKLCPKASRYDAFIRK